MTDLKKLQIGNWVYKDQIPMQVKVLGEDYCYLDFPNNKEDLVICDPEEISPIPISERILLKSGFKYNDTVIQSLMRRLENNIRVICSCDSIRVYSKYHCICKIEVHYIHELQNGVMLASNQYLEIKFN